MGRNMASLALSLTLATIPLINGAAIENVKRDLTVFTLDGWTSLGCWRSVLISFLNPSTHMAVVILKPAAHWISWPTVVNIALMIIANINAINSATTMPVLSTLASAVSSLCPDSWRHPDPLRRLWRLRQLKIHPET
jgi:hypothetical protein